jgi:hypothetical protein
LFSQHWIYWVNLYVIKFFCGTIYFFSKKTTMVNLNDRNSACQQECQPSAYSLLLQIKQIGCTALGTAQTALAQLSTIPGTLSGAVATLEAFIASGFGTTAVPGPFASPTIAALEAYLALNFGTFDLPASTFTNNIVNGVNSILPTNTALITAIANITLNSAITTTALTAGDCTTDLTLDGIPLGSVFGVSLINLLNTLLPDVGSTVSFNVPSIAGAVVTVTQTASGVYSICVNDVANIPTGTALTLA